MTVSGKGLTTYGPLSILVTPDMISNILVNTSSGTTYVVSSDFYGGAIVTATFSNTGSCSSNEGISIAIKDVIPWTRLYCSFVSVGGCSCWGWNGDNGYGTGINLTGNLKPYSAASGDFTRNEFNVWNLPQFIKYFSACDNNSTNYMHTTYLVGSSRGFDMYCRRKSMATLVGPSHGRACTPVSINHGSVTISKMRIII